MLKRKLKANIENLLTAKRKAEDGKLDLLFRTTGTDRPTTVVGCLQYIRALVDWRKFCGK